MYLAIQSSFKGWPMLTDPCVNTMDKTDAINQINQLIIMKHLGISGGGTKIGGLFGAAEQIILNKGFKPDIISGISAGAVLSLPLALGKFEDLRNLVVNFTYDDFFSKKPMNKDGKPTIGAFIRAVMGKPYLGRQDNLEKKLTELISRSEYEAYQNDNSKPDCIVCSVDFVTGKRFFYSLKDRTVDYNKFPKVVNASASIPIWTNPIELMEQGKKRILYDGGVRDHIASHWILSESDYANRITENVSIFSRPANYDILSEDYENKNLIDVLMRYIDIVNTEVSKNDEQLADAECKAKGIKNTKIYLPKIMENVYDVNPSNLLAMYEAGGNAAADYDGSVVV